MTKWMDIAESLMGTKEAPGSVNNPVIISWAKGLGGWIGQYYTKDEIPWCGLFVAHCLNKAGLSYTQKSLSAREWANWGVHCEPQLGAVMVFTRDGGGHVGFYKSEDAEAYHILGGNQGDKVSVVRVGKNRFLEARWPKEVPIPVAPKKVTKKLFGFLSGNEK